MDNIIDYITVFTQTPLAVIQMYFIYKVLSTLSDFMKEVIKILKKEKV